MSEEVVKPGYKKTEIGVIPEDWDVEPIGIQIDLLTGFPFPSNCYSNSGIRLLRGSNIKRGDIDWSEEITEYWKQETADLRRYFLNNGDLVISMDGSLVGKSYAQITIDDMPSLLVQRVARIRSQKIDIGFLKQFIGSDRFVKYSDSVKTVTAIPHISPDDIRKFIIPIPPALAEQHAIVAALSDADGLIGSLETLIAKKQAIKQAAMQQLLTGRTRLPGFVKSTGYKNTEMGVIPEDWEVKMLGNLGTFMKGKGIKRDDVSDEGLECIRYGEIYTQYNNYIKILQSRIPENIAATALPIQTGDLLFAGSGETSEEIGKCVAYLGYKEAFAGGDVVVLRPLGQNSLYLGHLLNHGIVAQQKARYGQGDAIVHISARNLAMVRVPLPSNISEQTAIATVLSDMDAEIAALEQCLEKTRQIKQGMMQQLLTGKVRLVTPLEAEATA